MLLLALVQSAFSGGPPAWNPTEYPLADATLHPATVQMSSLAGGYTVVAITNNISAEMMIDLTINGASGVPESDSGFRVLKEQADVLCPVPATDAPHGDDMPDYSRCQFTLPAGQQRNVIIAYSPKGPGKDVFDKVDVVAIPHIDLQPWHYLVEVPLIGHPGGEAH